MIEGLKELEKLLKLCRKQGVMSLEFDNVKFHLGDLPPESITTQTSDATDNPYQGFPSGVLSPEELQYYSVHGWQPQAPDARGEAS